MQKQNQLHRRRRTKQRNLKTKLLKIYSSKPYTYGNISRTDPGICQIRHTRGVH
jgi:hypothetical protein